MTIIKKGWFTDLEILEIHQQLHKETNQHGTNTITETLNTEKSETPNQKQTQSFNNRNITHANTMEQTGRKK